MHFLSHNNNNKLTKLIPINRFTDPYINPSPNFHPIHMQHFHPPTETFFQRSSNPKRSPGVLN